MSSSGISFEIIKEFVAACRAPLAGKIIVYPSNPIALVTSKEAETLI
jgi:predicted dinucleotide-binding enzyme